MLPWSRRGRGVFSPSPVPDFQFGDASVVVLVASFDRLYHKRSKRSGASGVDRWKKGQGSNGKTASTTSLAIASYSQTVEAGLVHRYTRYYVLKLSYRPRSKPLTPVNISPELLDPGDPPSCESDLLVTESKLPVTLHYTYTYLAVHQTARQISSVTMGLSARRPQLPSLNLSSRSVHAFHSVPAIDRI